MKSTKAGVLALALILAVTGNAAAHYSFIYPEKFRVSPGEALVVGFHASDGFPDSTQLPRRLQSHSVHTASGTSAIAELRDDACDDKGKCLRQAGTVTLPAGYSILTAVNPARSADMKPQEFTDYLKEESLTQIIDERAKLGETDKPGRERYSMYLKSIVLAGTPNDRYKQVVGLPIEIVPEKDFFQLKSGESLPVRVLFKGAPAANLQLFATTKGKPAQKFGKTDANGRIAVPVTSGPWTTYNSDGARYST